MASNPVANGAAVGGTHPSAEMVSRSRIRIMLLAMGVRFPQEQKTSWDVIIYTLNFGRLTLLGDRFSALLGLHRRAGARGSPTLECAMARASASLGQTPVPF